jgi:hypothetical protein
MCVGSFIFCPNKKSLEGKYKGRRLHGRPRHRWDDNIEMDLKEIAWEGMDEINKAEDMDKWRGDVNMVMDLEVLYSAVNRLIWRRCQIEELHIFVFRMY